MQFKKIKCPPAVLIRLGTTRKSTVGLIRQYNLDFMDFITPLGQVIDCWALQITLSSHTSHNTGISHGPASATCA